MADGVGGSTGNKASTFNKIVATIVDAAKLIFIALALIVINALVGSAQKITYVILGVQLITLLFTGVSILAYRPGQERLLSGFHVISNFIGDVVSPIALVLGKSGPLGRLVPLVIRYTWMFLYRKPLTNLTIAIEMVILAQTWSRGLELMVPYWVFFGAPLLVSILETTDYFLMRGEADWPARTWFQAYIRVYNLHPSKVSGIDAKTESIRSIIAQLEQILVPGYYIVGTVFQMSMFPATLNREETSCMASYKRPYDRNLGDLIPHVVNSLAANLPVHRIYHHFRNRQDPRGFVEMVMRDSATNGNGQEPSDSRIQPSPRPVAVVTNPRTEGKPTMQTQPISSAIDTQHDAEGGSDDSGETVRLGILIEQLSITPPESSDDSPFIEPGEVVDIPEDPKQDPPPWEA